MQLFTLSRNWRGCHDNEFENFIVLRIDLSFYFWNLDLLFKCRKEIITDFLIHLDKFYFKNLRRKGTASPTFQNEACRNIEIDLPFNFKIGAWLWNETIGHPVELKNEQIFLENCGFFFVDLRRLLSYK